jgi:CxxC-x17-CxxC domain-containing protein
MEDREMHKAVCSDCGQECEVPFKPEGDRPVRCQDCFRKNRPQRSFGGRGRGGGFGGRGFDRRPREMHKTTCAACKKECEVPFKPTEGRDVFCQDCFEKQKDGNFDESKDSKKSKESKEDKSEEPSEEF